VADALDALTVKRPYREALPFEEALRTILTASGKNFDPAVIETFTKAANELKGYIGKIMLYA
jgi:HD-GYP domain-containing protein (c-di-GMP phosphodiesterase class II)